MAEATSLYSATPLEQAYGLYLSNTVFGIPLPLQNNGVALQISGRNAVPFLTRSGVDRTLLRSIWSVADPANLGSLASVHQLHVILRLVAMAQAGFLGHVHGSTASMTQGMVVALRQCSSRQLNLPFFSNVVVLQHNQLMANYGPFIVNNNNNNMNMNMNMNAIPAVQQQQQQQQQQPPQMQMMGTAPPQAAPTEPTPAPAPAALQSVGDAFGGVVEVRDAPLTPLKSYTGMPDAQSQSQLQSHSKSAPDAFSGMGPARNALLPALGSDAPPTPTPAAAPTTLETPFATPSATPTPVREPFGAASNSQSAGAAVGGGFGPSGGGYSTPSRSQSAGGFGISGSDGGGGGGFGIGGGGFWSTGGSSVADLARKAKSTPTSTTPTNSYASTATPTRNIAGNVPPMPSPGGGFGTTTNIPSILATVSDDEGDDDDDFGDFGSAPAAPATTSFATGATFMGLPQPPATNDLGTGLMHASSPPRRPFVTDSGRAGSEPFGGGSAPVVPASGSTVSVSDAFGIMGPVEDAPLPSLGAFGTVSEPPVVGAASDGGEDDDGFGDFGSAPAATTETPNVLLVTDAGPSLSISDAFGDTQDAPLPSLEMMGSAPSTPMRPSTQSAPLPSYGDAANNTAPTSGGAFDDDDEGFGAFADAPSQAAQASITGGSESSDDDDFGDFGGATSDPNPPPDMLGGFGAAANTGGAPLPPPGPIPEPPTPGVMGHGRSTSIDDAFGDFSAPADAPLPSLQMMGSAPSTPMRPAAHADDFGGFSDANQASTPQPGFVDAGHGRSDSIEDAFGGFSAPADAPLPSLEMMGSAPSTPMRPTQSDRIPQPNDTNDDDDDFGGFSEAIPEPTPQGGGYPVLEDVDSDDDDGFGDFGAPPPGEETGTSQVMDMFGSGGDGLPSSTDTSGQPSTPDPFADMPLNDAPLPSLAVLSAPPQSSDFAAVEDVDSDDDDEFGDFGAAPSAEEAGAGTSEVMDMFGSGEGGLHSSVDGDMPSNDAPLPSLAALSAPPQSSELPVVEDADSDDDNDDEFGAFGAAPSETVAETSQPVDMFGSGEGGLHSSTDATPMPDIGEPLSTSDDPFGDMPNDAPLPSLATLSAPPNDDDDDFGAFETPVAVPSDPVTADATPMPDIGGPLSTSDNPFGDMPSNDAPLPSLEVLSAPPTPLNATSGDNDDDFGAFETPVAVPSNPVKDEGGDLLDMFGAGPQVTTGSEEEDDFGDFGDAEQATPVQESAQTVPAEEDLFGDFGSAQQTTPVKDSAHIAQPGEQDLFGNFGSAKQTTPVREPAQPVDLFGDFGSTQQTTPVQEPAQPVEQDLFGDFGSANQDIPVEQNANDFGDFTSGTTPPVEGNDESAPSGDGDFFGAFDSGDAVAPIEQTVEKAQSGDEHDFVDFGSADITAPLEAAVNVPSEEGDAFGDFGGAGFSSPTEPAATVPADEDDDFGDFGGADFSSPQEQSADSVPADDDFGDFGGADFSSQPEQNVDAVPSEDNDDFGDFGGADFSSPPEQNVDAVPSEDNDDFGDFGSADFSPVEQSSGEFTDFTVVEAPQSNEPQSNDNFGDFTSFQESSTPAEQASAPVATANDDNDSDDWGDFEAISSPSTTENNATEETRTCDRIRSLAVQLPDCVLRKAGVSGDHVDLGEAFEINVGTKSSMTGTNRRRVQRCIHVLESLTSTDNSRLASTFWVQVFDVVNEELETAKTLLVEASSFSSSDWKEIKAPLDVMVRGLAEYMRVTRSIVASIGDVLLLDESAMLTVDTWASTWCSLSVLEKALDCEKKWKEIQGQLIQTPLRAVETATVQEIRSDANETFAGSSFCHLTLQPLRQKHKATTRQEISFQGRCFMACSANFLVNRCPFFVVGDEI